MHTVYLKPGEYYFGDQPVQIHTVLGSCVAVSMFHRRTGLAALCHTLAPDCRSAVACQKRCDRPYHYVSCTIPSMIRSFSARMIPASDVEVKLFGGAALIDAPEGDAHGSSVGMMNIAAARNSFQKLGIILKASDVGGRCGRKIIFDTRTGDVLVKRMRHMA
jgi:chemotaxis protein CheD